VDRARLGAAVLRTLAAERAPDGELSVAFVGDRTMRRINRDYRSVDKPTDVLSFSYVDESHAGGVLGEIFVSPAVAARQAKEAGCGMEEEVVRLVLHGLLHVLGYDHDTGATRRRMFARQERYLGRHLEGSPAPAARPAAGGRGGREGRAAWS
jgi:probable rRNA maturation factor